MIDLILLYKHFNHLLVLMDFTSQCHDLLLLFPSVPLLELDFEFLQLSQGQHRVRVCREHGPVLGIINSVLLRRHVKPWVLRKKALILWHLLLRVLNQHGTGTAFMHL